MVCRELPVFKQESQEWERESARTWTGRSNPAQRPEWQRGEEQMADPIPLKSTWKTSLCPRQEN
ncbi:hypothetical protein N7454_010265 [Penicillium verhagenii]|nr:hypothetical protein N7454_010265 [Penicillium verhagenii]